MNNKKLVISSFFQSVGLVGYCFLIGWFIFNKAEVWFGEMNEAFGSMLFLMLFVLSALICGLIAFGYPAMLFFKTKDGKASLILVLFTAGWLLFFVFLTGIVMSIVF